ERMPVYETGDEGATPSGGISPRAAVVEQDTHRSQKPAPSRHEGANPSGGISRAPLAQQQRHSAQTREASGCESQVEQPRRKQSPTTSSSGQISKVACLRCRSFRVQVPGGAFLSTGQ